VYCLNLWKREKGRLRLSECPVNYLYKIMRHTVSVEYCHVLHVTGPSAWHTSTARSSYLHRNEVMKRLSGSPGPWGGQSWTDDNLIAVLGWRRSPAWANHAVPAAPDTPVPSGAPPRRSRSCTARSTAPRFPSTGLTTAHGRRRNPEL